MTKKIFKEIIISLVLVVLIISFLDPFMLWMPSQILMMVLFGLVVVYIIYTVFLWREQAKDEREELHRLLASRYSWLAGSIVLIAAVIVQGLKHDIDPWILYSLLVMVLVKTISRIYGSFKY
ncbi:MAG: hypothetical protein WCV71_03965 [Patescibacteria group bacterium]|jgi:cobalamin synthase